MVERDKPETALIHPPSGAYRVTSVAADGSATYPDNGRGAKTTTAGNAHWTDMGLPTGAFTAMVTHVTVPSGANYVTLVELTGGGTSQVMPPGTHPLDPPLRFEGGFSFQTTGGGTIAYTIHEHRQPTT